MMVASSFDLWRKDAFFSAAEEVQESADALESAYRVWLREKREGPPREDMVELSRDLQTALGTAKWQLEEFERAVTLSYRSCSEESAKIRHRQFVLALANQISQVETELGEYLGDGSMEPLRWIRLDEKECADLAMFLGGTSETSLADATKVLSHEVEASEKVSVNRVKGTDFISKSSKSNGPDELMPTEFRVAALDSHSKVKLGAGESDICANINEVTHDPDRVCSATNVWGSPDFVTLDMSNDSIDRNSSSSGISSMQKSRRKDLTTFLCWKQWWGEHSQTRKIILSNIRCWGICSINQLLQMVGVVHRRPRIPQPHRWLLTCVLLFLLTVCITVPFIVYST